MTRTKTRTAVTTLLIFAITILSTAVAQADNNVLVGPERNEFPFAVSDWSDCTGGGEFIDWQLLINEFVYIHISGNDNKQIGHLVSHFSWTGTAVGRTSGYVWETRGGGKDTLNLDLGDSNPFREVFLENAMLNPISDGAPKLKFEARVKVKNDESGLPVIDVLSFEFRCLGPKD